MPDLCHFQNLALWVPSRGFGNDNEERWDEIIAKAAAGLLPPGTCLSDLPEDPAFATLLRAYNHADGYCDLLRHRPLDKVAHAIIFVANVRNKTMVDMLK